MTEQEQPKRNLLRRASRLIPGWGVYDYMKSGDISRDTFIYSTIKAVGHTLYGALTAICLTASLSTGTINPKIWFQKIGDDNEIFASYIEQQAEMQRTQKEQYSALYNQLFGTNGLADINRDGKISVLERVDALDRAESISFENGKFVEKTLTSHSLQKAIDSYSGGQE